MVSRSPVELFFFQESIKCIVTPNLNLLRKTASILQLTSHIFSYASLFLPLCYHLPKWVSYARIFCWLWGFVFLPLLLCYGITRHSSSSTIHNTAGSSWTFVLSYVAHLWWSETKTSDRAKTYMTVCQPLYSIWLAWRILVLRVHASKCLVKCMCHCLLVMLFVCEHASSL